MLQRLKILPACWLSFAALSTSASAAPADQYVSAKGFGPVNLEKLEGSRSGEERLTTQAPIRIDCTQR